MAQRQSMEMRLLKRKEERLREMVQEPVTLMPMLLAVPAEGGEAEGDGAGEPMARVVKMVQERWCRELRRWCRRGGVETCEDGAVECGLECAGEIGGLGLEDGVCEDWER